MAISPTDAQGHSAFSMEDVVDLKVSQLVADGNGPKLDFTVDGAELIAALIARYQHAGWQNVSISLKNQTLHFHLEMPS